MWNIEYKGKIKGDIENSTILEAWKREQEYIISLNIPAIQALTATQYPPLVGTRS